jgi:dimethylamine monooxygenase subunit B
MWRRFERETIMINEKTIPVFIKSIKKETDHIKSFTLSPIEGYKLPSFSSGSHLTTYIEANKDLIIRPYSLTNHPDQNDSYQIAIRLSESSKGGSLYWHHKIKVGDKLQISYPKNHFPLSFHAKRHVFYAAGIGITPILTMMAELKDKGVSFELHYAAKSKDHCAFYQEIFEKYEHQAYFYFSNERNRLSKDSLLEHPIGTHVYFCGPEEFIGSFSEEALRIGYPKTSIHSERFTSFTPKELFPFQIRLSSGGTITVSKKQTLLGALIENGIQAPYSCRIGRCGTCELKVIEGEIDHYDSFLTEEQRIASKSIISCVSRAKSNKLVIDL